MDFHASGMLKVSRIKDFPPLSDPTVTIMTISETGYVQQYTGDGKRKHGLISSHTLRPGEPLFGIAHSGHYFVSNATGAGGMTITTDKILTGAWFGRNQYYGFGEGGADQVTIVALNGANELGSVVFDLP